MDAIESRTASNVDYLYNNLRDTLDREISIMASDYTRLRKYIGKNQVSDKKKMEDLTLAQKQLAALRRDLSNNKISGGLEKIPDYVQSESQAVALLSGGVTAVMTGYNGILQDFERLHPKMNQFVDSLKQQVRENNLAN